ncbi:MAG: hypothetical protein BWX71_01278 [Deltaproteobacteria bacterium ADurb.Bin072]|nr:MAG: hypothetical protein BWX71_01278 [Deltaproteobacteria bacterium ADurb.Bin072]
MMNPAIIHSGAFHSRRDMPFILEDTSTRFSHRTNAAPVSTMAGNSMTILSRRSASMSWNSCCSAPESMFSEATRNPSTTLSAHPPMTAEYDAPLSPVAERTPAMTIPKTREEGTTTARPKLPLLMKCRMAKAETRSTP